MKSDHLHLNSDKTQFIWVGSRHQLANVTVTEIVLNGFSTISVTVTLAS